MKAKFIVTGGAGFIGSNIVAALNARGEGDILVVDERDLGDKAKNLEGLSYAECVGKDAFREALNRDRLGDAAVVFHMGACSSTTETDADFLEDNNYLYTRELCDWCLKRRVRFVYASSGATYGDGSLGYSDDDAVTPTLKPLNLYGLSKQKFDMWALESRLFDRIVGLKFFNVYGPREDHKGDMRSVVHKAYGQIMQTGKVMLFKSYKPAYRDGEQVRDFVYVKDAVDVALYFGENREANGLFNVGTGTTRTWNDLVTAVFAATGREVRVDYIEMPEHLRDRYQYKTQADIRKLRRIGYDRPFTSLEEGVRDYVQSYLAPRA